MRFKPIPPILGMTAYAARAGRWRFLILDDGGVWTVSYRLAKPKDPVSASSTIRRTFGSFADAYRAAEDMHAELGRQH